MTSNMAPVIIPKSDQQNADDFLAGPRTITVTSVTIRPGTEQPVSIHFEGDDNKPYKPCKGMCRVLVALWGPDAKEYAGRSMTLYRDPKVKWAGLEVGGIRISHMSHIERDHVMALTESKQSRKPYTVKPLATKAPPQTERPAESASEPKEPEATRAAGQSTEFLDDVDREVAAEDAKKPPTLKQMCEKIDRAMADHGGDPENVKAMWDLYREQVGKMPAKAKAALEEAYRGYLSEAGGDAEGRVEDERAGELAV